MNEISGAGKSSGAGKAGEAGEGDTWRQVLLELAEASAWLMEAKRRQQAATAGFHAAVKKLEAKLGRP